ncbi:MAG: bis(5'-nucleosyl)-tetraphosphatase (symmetrical) YqeK [Moorellaceae bacterium]
MLEYYKTLLASRLTPRRWRHSQGVATYAVKLALRYGVSPDKAELAGWMHDYARDLPEQELLALGEKAGLIGQEIEKRFPVLLHAPVGAWLLRTELGLEDEEILQAISRHTVGSPAMSPLDKIVYLADALEPGRQYPGVEELRRLVEADLDGGLLKALESSIYYVLEKGHPLHPATVEARNYLLLKEEGRGWRRESERGGGAMAGGQNKGGLD